MHIWASFEQPITFCIENNNALKKNYWTWSSPCLISLMFTKKKGSEASPRAEQTERRLTCWGDKELSNAICTVFVFLYLLGPTWNSTICYSSVSTHVPCWNEDFYIFWALLGIKKKNKLCEGIKKWAITLTVNFSHSILIPTVLMHCCMCQGSESRRTKPLPEAHSPSELSHVAWDIYITERFSNTIICLPDVYIWQDKLTHIATMNNTSPI